MAAEPIVHVVDDDPAVRDSLAFLLDTAGLVSRLYESPLRLLAIASDLGPGCIVTDIRMPDMTGLEMARRLADLGIRHPVIVMTGHADTALAIEAVRAGVRDFIEKPFDDEVLLAAIRRVLADQTRGADDNGRAAEIRTRLGTLSIRERQVLEGLVAGQPNKITAYDLGISPRTVEVYRANVMTKMSAGSLSELVRMTILAERG